MAQKFRPLSPHLQIWRFTLTMTLSILHRITGIGLYIGTLLIVLWLGAAALGAEPLAVMNAIFGHWFVQFILFCFTWAVFMHLAGGVKHFIWDMGKGFGPEREIIAASTLGFSIIATIAVWAIFVWF